MKNYSNAIRIPCPQNLRTGSRDTTRNLRTGHHRNNSSKAVLDIADADLLIGSPQRTSVLLNTKIFHQSDFRGSQRLTWSDITDQRRSVAQSNELLKTWTDQHDPSPPYKLSWHEEYGENVHKNISGAREQGTLDTQEGSSVVPVGHEYTSHASQVQNRPNEVLADIRPSGRASAINLPSGLPLVNTSPAPTRPLPITLFGGSGRSQMFPKIDSIQAQSVGSFLHASTEDTTPTSLSESANTFLVEVIYGSSMVSVDIGSCKDAVEVHAKVVKAALHPAPGDVSLYGLWTLNAGDEDPTDAQNFTDLEWSKMRRERDDKSEGQLILRRNNHAIEFTLDLEMSALARVRGTFQGRTTKQLPVAPNSKVVPSARVREIARVHRTPTRGSIENLRQRPAKTVSAAPNADASDPKQSLAAKDQLRAIDEGMQPAGPDHPLLVEALYDYYGEDLKFLSFGQGDIIQLLTVVESGWYDGVLNNARGWFPGNYCRMIGRNNGKNVLEACQKSAHYRLKP